MSDLAVNSFNHFYRTMKIIHFRLKVIRIITFSTTVLWKDHFPLHCLPNQ